MLKESQTVGVVERYLFLKRKRGKNSNVELTTATLLYDSFRLNGRSYQAQQLISQFTVQRA
jgi:hypothetical protein